jgi:hypothetical protein
MEVTEVDDIPKKKIKICSIFFVLVSLNILKGLWAQYTVDKIISLFIQNLNIKYMLQINLLTLG